MKKSLLIVTLLLSCAKTNTLEQSFKEVVLRKVAEHKVEVGGVAVLVTGYTIWQIYEGYLEYLRVCAENARLNGVVSEKNVAIESGRTSYRELSYELESLRISKTNLETVNKRLQLHSNKKEKEHKEEYNLVVSNFRELQTINLDLQKKLTTAATLETQLRAEIASSQEAFTAQIVLKEGVLQESMLIKQDEITALKAKQAKLEFVVKQLCLKFYTIVTKNPILRFAFKHYIQKLKQNDAQQAEVDLSASAQSLVVPSGTYASHVGIRALSGISAQAASSNQVQEESKEAQK
ncbi:MAG: hypothetical protein P4L22_04460 [Candidatus Babeliales bacterium]|nr:hypothetical protein [Candidatus Babeliales bacterium]